MTDYDVDDEKINIYKMLKYSPDYSSQVLSKAIFGVEDNKAEEKYAMNKDEILIGFRNKYFNRGEEVTLNLNMISENGEMKSRIICIIGKKGSGKSVMGSVIADSFINKYKMPIFAVDPFGEFYTKKNPFAYDSDKKYQDFIDESLSYYNMKRHGLKCIVIAPEFIGKQSNVDIYYKLTYYDFKLLAKYDSGEARSILANILGIKDNYANIDLLASVMADKSIKNFSGLMRAMRRIQDRSISVIYSSIRYKLEAGILSDGDKDSPDRCDIYKLMNEYDMVIFKGRLRNEVDDDYDTIIYNSFLKMAVSLITNAQNRFISGDKDSEIRSKNGVLFLIDEADSVAPRVGNCSIRKTFEQLATKYRKALINIIMMVQDSEKLDEAFLDQSDYLISSKVESVNKGVLLKRGISQETIDNTLAELKQEQLTAINTKVNEFFVAGLNNDYKVFTPICPLTDFFKTRSHSDR